MWPITHLDSEELASIGKCYEFCLKIERVIIERVIIERVIID